jgi:site-specific DNA recombinase
MAANPNPNPIGASRLRVGSPHQPAPVARDSNRSFVALQRRAAACKADQLDAEVFGEYLDFGGSAKSTHRPALERMLRDIKEEPPDYLITYSLDRLTRSLVNHLEIREQLMAAHVVLVVADGELDPTDLGTFAAVVDTVCLDYRSPVDRPASPSKPEKEAA